MCGLAGMIGPGGKEAAWILDNALAHRGPDGAGRCFFRLDESLSPAPDDGDITLVHRRLAILDIRPCAAQPMASVDGRHWLVYNGEIYNYRELRRRLEVLGERFSSSGDSEVLLRLLAREGEAAIHHLEGMFAFAWLDRSERRLVLARDHLGIKPLYFAQSGQQLAFASEIPALLALPWLSRAADEASVADYLAHGLTDHRPGTCFSAISQVPSGQFLDIPIDQPDGAMQHRWWYPPQLTATGTEACDLTASLTVAVSSHLQADRPVGVALSGGIDSSAIISLARRSMGPEPRIHAIGYQADDSHIGEAHWMELAAHAARADLHAVSIAPDDVVGDLDDLVRCQGEPFGSSSIYAQYRVMRSAANANLPVMLSGQGADELFAGYPILVAARAVELLLCGDPIGAQRLVAGMPGLRWRNVIGQLFRGWRRACGLPCILPPWFNPRLMQQLPPDPFIEQPGRDLLRRRMREALLHTNLPMLLRYEDRNSMRWGIESRVPFLHRPLIESVLNLPSNQLIASDGLSKVALRRALHGIVPDAILSRRDKIGFATPESSWLRQLAPWVDAVITNAGRTPAFLDLDAFRDHWHLVVAGRRPYTPACWRTLNLLRWTDLASVIW